MPTIDFTERMMSHSSDASHYPTWPVRVPIHVDVTWRRARSDDNVVVGISSPGDSVQNKTPSATKTSPAVSNAGIRLPAPHPPRQDQEVVWSFLLDLLLFKNRMVFHPSLAFEAERSFHLFLLQLSVGLF